MNIKVSVCVGVLALFLTAPVGATQGTALPSEAGVEASIVLAQTQGMDRRGGRRDGRGENRDDRQDCRGEEGAVGGDKRDCKQDARSGDGDDAPDGAGEATTD
jgi:hypothetical protein